MSTRTEELYDRVLKASGATTDQALKRLLVDVANYLNDASMAFDNIETKLDGAMLILKAYDV